MNIKLNKSDWIILSVVYSVTIILNCIDYYRIGNNLIEYIVDLPTSIIISISLILIFIKVLVPSLLIKDKKYLQFFIFALLILILFGTLDNLIGRLSAGKTIKSISNVFLYLQNGLYNATSSVGFPLGLLLIKKFYY